MDGAIQVLAANGKPNFNSRRTVEVTVTNPQGTNIYTKKRVWQEETFSVASKLPGTYNLWCVAGRGCVACGRLHSTHQVQWHILGLHVES